MLHEGARIWVNIPGAGYVGVGRVLEEAVPADEFMVDDGDGNSVHITDLAHKVATAASKPPEKVELLVRVEWIKTVPASEAFREKGFFGNQNSAAKPRAKKWQHTVERLRTRFGVTD